MAIAVVQTVHVGRQDHANRRSRSAPIHGVFRRGFARGLARHAKTITNVFQVRAGPMVGVRKERPLSDRHAPLTSSVSPTRCASMACVRQH